MREVVSIHVGQAGVQIGNACCKSISTPQPRLFLRWRVFLRVIGSKQTHFLDSRAD